MLRIEEAARRLEKAVEHLEAVCARLPADTSDKHKLASALAAAKADYAALVEVTGSVATRLDGTIARLNAVLEH
jgi:hypothetical protein